MTTPPVSPNDEPALLADIAALRARGTDTRELYREACALLFFRYGVTPTANKLYSLVRKGSMSTPAEVLNRFWQDLRERTRVKIDHPDLPEALKQVAADAVLTIWQAASETSASELATLRAEARHLAQEAEVARDRAIAETQAAHQASAAIQTELKVERTELAKSRDAVASERQAHATTEARLQEVRRQLDDAASQLALMKTELGAEIGRARERADAADAREQAHEKRALREIDQERTARQKSDRQCEDLQRQLAAARAELQDMAVEHAAAIATLRADLDGMRQQAEIAATQQRATVSELDSARARLQEAELRAGRAETEAETTRKLVSELRKAPAARGGHRSKAA
ncbi:DNA-binding protein [Paraburkholderia humisilvae]|uniref:KfrA N-terminal DNA-binding domain-containing protein n=1 Tax=Paraburkholderia humisilvae TaxID=627669 RepID=A0A6J5FCV7_9BURK|nr:DNA-binding protein [Paraburkholderia humisilvae]CAB3775297.1 hypothetical protein LMG29542_08679 [Paraburkholderia humisilvae]